MKHSYTNIQQLYNKSPWRSSSKFIPLAIRHGFKESDVRDFLTKVVASDKRIKIKPVYLPIYSKIGDSYQFDTFIQNKGPHFLIFININTRKAYSDLMGLNNNSTNINSIKNMDGIEYVLKSELEEYVGTKTLEDVITQINTKFDSIDVQKKRWMFKITIPANSQSAKINMNEDLTKYNVVLSNSDGTHVFAYQETNSGFEIIALTVILTSTYLIVEANKICKNAYNVYLCLD